MPPQRPSLLFLPLLALALSGCPRRVDFGKDGQPKTLEELLARVAYAEKQIVSVKGEARLTVESPQGKGSTQLFAAVTHPALIHLEQLDFFGRPQGVLITDGARFGLYLAQEGQFLRGPATPLNLGKFLPVVLPPAELAAVMLGRAPRIPSDETRYRFEPFLGVYVVDITRGRVIQHLHVEPPSYRVVKSWAENLDAYEVAFGDIATYGEVTLPRSAAIEAKSAKLKVELQWKDVALNEAPDLTLFELEPPEGVPVVEVDAEGRPIKDQLAP